MSLQMGRDGPPKGTGKRCPNCRAIPGGRSAAAGDDAGCCAEASVPAISAGFAAAGKGRPGKSSASMWRSPKGDRTSAS